MKLIDKLTEYEKNKLLRWHLMPLLTKTTIALDRAELRSLSSEWEAHMNILVTLVTTARQEIFDERKGKALDRGSN